MDVDRLQQGHPQPQASPRLATHARLLRGISGFAQIGLMVALVVMWKQYRVPFGTAFERCFIAGVLVYVTLGIIASIMLTLARVQPLQLLLRHVLAVLSLVIFLALRYVYKMAILQAVVTWAVIYIAARILARRIESRAMQRFRAQ